MNLISGRMVSPFIKSRIKNITMPKNSIQKSVRFYFSNNGKYDMKKDYYAILSLSR